MKKRPRNILAVFFIFFSLLFFLQFEAFHYPKNKELDRRINYLEEQINKPLDSNSAIYDIASTNPEFVLFTYSFTSFALTNISLNDSISSHLYDAYQQSEFMLLESYPGMIWIPDNTVAIASLKEYYKNTGQHKYDDLCNDWLVYMKNNYVDSTTKLFYSTVNSSTGNYQEEVRGSMIGWSIMFMNYIDTEYAKEMYSNYKNYFSKNYIVFRLFKERYKNNKTSEGDIDSGPIIRGYSIPANQFALANAIASGDKRTAKKMERLVNFGTKKIKKDNKLRYETRFYKEPISPMSEALMLFALTI